MRLTLIVTIILITVTSVSALTINEINYNPQGDDNNKEYVELFSSTFLNLTNYTIEDLSSSDILTLVKLSSSNFYLIVEDSFDYSLIDANVYTIGSAIGNNLNNNNDQITIKDLNGTIINTFSYDSSMGANDNGKSLCMFPNEIGIFNECEQTPGLTNIYQPPPLQNNTTIQNNTQINIVNNTPPNNTRPIGELKIRINEILPDPIGDDSQIPNGEWIELINLGDKTEISGLIIKDSSGKTIIISDEITSKPTYINKNDFIVVYTGSKKGFLNNDEEAEVAIYSNDVKIDSVSYNNAKEGLSFSREESNLYYSEPTPDQKNLEKLSENDSTNVSLNSTIMITDTKFEGKTLIVSLDIYKADTNKELVEIWLSNNQSKRVSEISKIKVTTKNQNYSLTIPVILKEELISNEIELIAEGLGTAASLLLKTNLSETAANEKSEITTEAVYKGEKLVTNNKNIDYGKENKVTYESKRLKSKEYAIYLFIIVLIIVTILSIKKNDKN